MSIVALDAVSSAKRNLQNRIRTDEAQRAFVFVMGASDGAALESWLQDAGNLAAFEALVGDGVLFRSVLASETAFAAVLASEIAMTAVAASETAFAAVLASETAFAAVLASETAFAAVLASETAFAAVLASETAMTAVAASETAFASIISGGLPQAVDNAILSYTPNDRITFERQTQATNSGSFVSLVSQLDLTGYSTLNINMRCTTLGENTARMSAILRINGSTMLTLEGGDSTFQNRVVNISSINGLSSIEFGYASTDFGGADNYLAEFGKFYLEV